MYHYTIERRAPNKRFRYKAHIYYETAICDESHAHELDSRVFMFKFTARWWAIRTARKLDRQGWEDEVVEQQIISMPHAKRF